MRDKFISTPKSSNSISLTTGLSKLDHAISTLPKSALILIAARPFMGKTALALQMARHISLYRKKPSAYFTLGITKNQLSHKIYSAELEIGIEKIISKELSDDELNSLSESKEQLSKVPLHFFDETDNTIKEILGKAYQLKQQLGLEAVFIDYLQLMREPSNFNCRKLELVNIMQELKKMSEELQTPLIILSQLNRTLERRTDRRPILTDLLNYGEIESNADLVLFIYSDSYYNKASEPDDIAEIIIAKHNYGSTGKIDLIYSEQYQKYITMPEA